MNNPKAWTTLGTRDTGQTNKQNKRHNVEN